MYTRNTDHELRKCAAVVKKCSYVVLQQNVYDDVGFINRGLARAASVQLTLTMLSMSTGCTPGINDYVPQSVPYLTHQTHASLGSPESKARMAQELFQQNG